MSSTSSVIELRERSTLEAAFIRAAFAAHGDGRAAVSDRAEMIDGITRQLWDTFIAGGTEQSLAASGLCLVALGGYGRGVLFPSSDVDVLFLCADPLVEESAKPRIRMFCQEMWDLRLRVSPATRTLAECDRFYHDNVEFTISLLDCRFLAGDRSLFTKLHDEVLPRLVARERQPLVQRLAELTQTRHRKYGNTIFHLEPNLKDGPGGLRDYNVACWLSLIASLDKHRRWPRSESRDESARALDFLWATRCLLHYRSGRDDNALTWEAQDAAAAAGIGFQPGVEVETGAWMRAYFRHTRAIYRNTIQLLDEVPPARSSLYQQYQQWRSRVSNPDFSVANGRIYLSQPEAIRDPEVLLRLFEFIARHGLKLSADAERRIEQALPSIAAQPPSGAETWSHLRQILVLPNAAQALRAMHALGLLLLLVPEFHAIDALVIRDFYHRYTVDEHTFIAIESLHRLTAVQEQAAHGYAELLAETEQPELLYLTLLLHDVGKGSPPGESHVQAGLRVIEPVLARLGLRREEADLVRFLIGGHLEMSAMLRRDIFDPYTVRALAQVVGTPERLKMLCLLTYADIKAVNPEALTPWKADDMWQLYMETANYLDRSVDEDRVTTNAQSEQVVATLRELDAAQRWRLSAFLSGLPRRYLLTHSPDEIAAHCEMAAQLAAEPVQVSLGRRGKLHQLTVVTPDRPALFATIAGALAGWGMNIVKANAFSNAAGTVVDTFLFVDSFRTLELNPHETERFKGSMAQVLLGEKPLEQLLQGRMRGQTRRPATPNSAPRISFDNTCSSHSTVLELIAPDRTGLLYRVASILSHHECNIDIALIDTEGRTALDVFYITAQGVKLNQETQQQLRDVLIEELTAE